MPKVQQYNRHFRNLVAQNYGAYDATTSKIAKRRIGVHIYSKITEAGGRFLDEKGIEMDRSKGILKVMKGQLDECWVNSGFVSCEITHTIFVFLFFSPVQLQTNCIYHLHTHTHTLQP